jgi:uncharacterized protein (TIGR00725 family)
MKTVIGVMGPGSDATKLDVKNAIQLGKLIAQNHWFLLSGGRNTGVMDAVNKGAKRAGGTTIGILPSDNRKTFSSSVDIAIITKMSSARNHINVLSSDIIIACGMGAGTASEVSLALKENKPVILLNTGKESEAFFKKIGTKNVQIAKSPIHAIEITKQLLRKAK